MLQSDHQDKRIKFIEENESSSQSDSITEGTPQNITSCKQNKFIFVSGGVCSSLGKGVAASSLGSLLESRGYTVRMVKCDPYINVDAGTMSPYQHGEVYVTDDGAETDLDLGNYARFTQSPLSRANSITTGQIYGAVIHNERDGQYLGSCVQVIPHITDEIKRRIMSVSDESEQPSIIIVEIGGTVGDIESIPFFEAERQFIHEQKKINAISVHLTLIPEVTNGEMKTKPTQHSVKALQETGIQPDVLICRASQKIEESARRKIAQYCNIETDDVFMSYNVSTTIYEIPLIFHQQKLDLVVLKKLNLEAKTANLEKWHQMKRNFESRRGKVRIGLIGKYIELPDAYKSLHEALFHAGLECFVEVEVVKFDSAVLEKGKPADEVLGSKDRQKQLDGILIPGGFGVRGINGMVNASSWARANKVPYFGICLGMQIMVIDWGRNVIGWSDADSSEFNAQTEHAVVSLLEEQVDVKQLGGTMRLGQYPAVTEQGSKIYEAYKVQHISERHRHRYEFSNKYRSEMIESGLRIGAQNEEGTLVECVEWSDHPFGVGVQFHPEFKSQPTKASPLFREFIAAAYSYQIERFGEVLH